MRLPNDLFEVLSDFSTNVYLNIREKAHGKVIVFYNKTTDCLEVTISNRALNIEPFHYTSATFLSKLQQGLSSFAVSKIEG